MQTLLPFLVILVLFWLLLILPQQRRQKRTQQMQASLGVGDKVVLTSGVLGVVHDVHDDYVAVEIAPASVIKVVRGAVGQVLPAESALAEALGSTTPGPTPGATAPAATTSQEPAGPTEPVVLDKKDPEGNE